MAFIVCVCAVQDNDNEFKPTGAPVTSIPIARSSSSEVLQERTPHHLKFKTDYTDDVIVFHAH